MATKHGEFKVYYFSFDDDEIGKITAALRSYGAEDLADEIYDQIYEGSSVSVGSLNIEVDTTELDAALKSARELENIMKSCGLGGA